MEYTRLGKSGLKVSKICLGVMNFGSTSFGPFSGDTAYMQSKEDALKIVEAAWKGGINFFDTADVYTDGGSERILGTCIKELGIPRNEVVIATKLFAPMTRASRAGTAHAQIRPILVNNYGLSRKHIFDAVEGSLERLQTNYIDLYQIHRWDDNTPIEETMLALHDLVKSGKVHYIGASTMFCWQFVTAQEVAKRNGWTQFVSMQNLYNLVYREEEKEMNRYCAETGVGLLPWSPLHGGYLARGPDASETARSKDVKKNNHWTTDESTEKVRSVVLKIAKERKVTPTEVSLAWLLHMEGVTAPVLGVSKLSHLDTAIKSVKLKLSGKELDELAEPYRPRTFQGLEPAPIFGRRAKL